MDEKSLEVHRVWRNGKSGIEIIAVERLRQTSKCGWTPEHDDGHQFAELARMAAKCAVDGTDTKLNDDAWEDICWGIIEKHGHTGKFPDRIHLLAVAGALIAAEIDRLQRC